MGCCNSKNRVRDVVDDQVIAGENELSNKNGRKPSITDQLTTERFIYVKPKDNNKNNGIDDSKISKWNGVKLENVSNSDFLPKSSEIEGVKELSNIDPSDHKRLNLLDKSNKSKNEIKSADDLSSIWSEYGQNKHPNDGKINESEANESDEELENELTAKRSRTSIKGKLLFKRCKVLEYRRAYEKRYELSLKRRINSRRNIPRSKLVFKSNYRRKHDPSFEADDEQEIEPKPDLEQNEIDYNSKYDSSFESESDEEKANDESKCDKVKNNDQSSVEADHKNSNQSLSIEKQLEEIMKELKTISKQMSFINGFKKFDQTNSQVENISVTNENLEKQVKKVESEDSIKNDSKNSQKPEIGKENRNLDKQVSNKSVTNLSNCGDNSKADSKAKFESENESKQVIKQQEENQKPDIGKQDEANLNLDTSSNKRLSETPLVKPRTRLINFTNTGDNSTADQVSENVNEKVLKQQQDNQKPEIGKQDANNQTNDKSVDQILLFKRRLEEILNESKQNRSKKRFEETNDVNRYKYDKKTSQEELSYSNHSNNNGEKELKKTEYEDSNSKSNGEIKQQKYIPNQEIGKQDAGNSKNRTNDKSVDQILLFKRQLEEIMKESKSDGKQISNNRSKKRFKETNGEQISLENISYFNNQTSKNTNKEFKNAESENSQKPDNSSKQEHYRPDLERQVDEWKSLIERLTSNNKLMSYALGKSRTEFRLVKDVGYYLAGCREAKSVAEKAWLAYVWITNNIEYDVPSFLSGDYRFCSPQSVLERGLAVCSGYAELYKKLCTQLGVECIEIGGYSKGFGYKIGQKSTREDHAWNAIPLGSDGKLRFIESTWGAGYLDRNTKFVKKFVPYYFAVPAHIFNETHHSESYTPTDGTKMFTIEEFENCPSNELGYHVLGLTCVNNTMRAITRTNKNPLVIEYTAPQKIYFTANLVDERTGRETKDGIFIQSEYSMTKDQKSRYCLIADIPEKGRNYKLRLYAKNKRGSEDEDNSYPMITEFLVVREGDEENSIPRYNLTFDYDLRLTSHFSRYINFKTNLLVMEFEDQNNSQTVQKIFFSTKLVDERTNREIKNAVIVQSEYSISKDQKSRYCMIIEVPEKSTKYKLKLYASNDDKVNTYPFLTDFILIREGDEEISIPSYNLTFDYDLRLTSHFSQYIKFKTNLLVMEFEDQNNSQTPQKIFFSTKLLEEKTGIEIKNAAVVQSEYSMFKDQKSRYCVIADIPEKRKKYKLQLFAKKELSSDYNKDYFPFLTEFLVTREGDEESYIPQYNLSFDHDIKLKSHYCQFIKFKTNPLVMEFEVPKHIKTLFKVKTMDDSEIEDAVFSQINPENCKTIVHLAVPRKSEKFRLMIYAKHARDQKSWYEFVSQMFLTRTRSNKNDDLRFCKVYSRGENCFIYSPIEYYLSSYNFIYEFKYFIKDAVDVAIVDSSQKWIHLKRSDNEKSIWKLSTPLRVKGKLTLYAKFNNNASYDGICYYQVD